MEICLLATNELVSKISDVQCKVYKQGLRLGVIYKITSPNGKSYIGQTANLVGRFGAYRKYACSGQQKLFCSLKKYGWTNFKKEILYISKPAVAKVVRKELNEKEIQYIALYDSTRYGLNLAKGGFSPLGNIPTRSQLLKGWITRKSNPNYVRPFGLDAISSDERSEIIKCGWSTRKANPSYVQPFGDHRRSPSEKARKNMSLAALGKPKSEETKQRMCEAWKKRLNDPNYVAPTPSVDTRLKMSIARTGTKRSEETKTRMKLAQKLSWEKRVRVQSEEARRNNGEAQKRAWVRRKVTS